MTVPGIDRISVFFLFLNDGGVGLIVADEGYNTLCMIIQKKIIPFSTPSTFSNNIVFPLLKHHMMCLKAVILDTGFKCCTFVPSNVWSFITEIVPHLII